MTKPNHLPECPYIVFDQQGQIPEAVIPMRCICAALRACEKRVLDDDVLAAAHHGQKGYEVGFRKGLDAAREKIMGLPYEIDGEIWIDRDEVIRWIDELRGEK